MEVFTNGGQYILNGTNPSLPTPYSDRFKIKNNLFHY